MQIANSSQMLPLAAALGLFLSTLFRVIVVTQFVLWNWSIVTDVDQWEKFIDSYPPNELPDPIVPPDSFLQGYRQTVDGFPVVQAVIEPLGVVFAAAALVVLGHK